MSWVDIIQMKNGYTEKCKVLRAAGVRHGQCASTMQTLQTHVAGVLAC